MFSWNVFILIELLFWSESFKTFHSKIISPSEQIKCNRTQIWWKWLSFCKSETFQKGNLQTFDWKLRNVFQRLDEMISALSSQLPVKHWLTSEEFLQHDKAKSSMRAWSRSLMLLFLHLQSHWQLLHTVLGLYRGSVELMINDQTLTSMGSL